MASTYSASLRLELPAAGDQSGTWGTTVNTNIGTLIEGAIAGYASVAVTTNPQVLTASNGTSDQARVALLNLTGTAGAVALYAPPASKQYVIANNTNGIVTIYNSTVLGNTTAAGAGAAIPAGATLTVYSNGTAFSAAGNYLPALTLGSALPIASGGTGATSASAALTALGAYPAINPNNYIASAGAPVQSVGGNTGVVTTAQISAAATAGYGYTPARSGANSDITSLSGLTSGTYGFLVVMDTSTQFSTSGVIKLAFVKAPASYTSVPAYDPANMYNVSTNVFTAPVTGWYQLSFTGGLYQFSSGSGTDRPYGYLNIQNNTTSKSVNIGYCDYNVVKLAGGGTASAGLIQLSGAACMYFAAGDTGSVVLANTQGFSNTIVMNISGGAVFSGKYLGI